MSASAAQLLVFEAAKPYEPRDSTKAKLRRAAERLQAHGLEHPHSRVERAWKGRAGAKIYLAIKAAFERWQASSSASDDRAIEAQFAQLTEAMNATDPSFYRPAIEAMRAALSARVRVVRDDS